MSNISHFIDNCIHFTDKRSWRLQILPKLLYIYHLLFDLIFNITILNYFIFIFFRYRYSDTSSAAGSWIYRIMDCDSTEKKEMLCQCFVEVVTESESKSQGVSYISLFPFPFAIVVLALIVLSLSSWPSPLSFVLISPFLPRPFVTPTVTITLFSPCFSPLSSRLLLLASLHSFWSPSLSDTPWILLTK